MSPRPRSYAGTKSGPVPTSGEVVLHQHLPARGPANITCSPTQTHREQALSPQPLLFYREAGNVLQAAFPGLARIQMRKSYQPSGTSPDGSEHPGKYAECFRGSLPLSRAQVESSVLPRPQHHHPGANKSVCLRILNPVS